MAAGANHEKRTGTAVRDPILEAHALSVWFPTGKRFFGPRQWVRAVDGVSLTVMAGETLAVVGGGGGGKTTLGRALVILQGPAPGGGTGGGGAVTRLRG